MLIKILVLLKFTRIKLHIQILKNISFRPILIPPLPKKKKKKKKERYTYFIILVGFKFVAKSV